jgi:hypothetical protein
METSSGMMDGRVEHVVDKDIQDMISVAKRRLIAWEKPREGESVLGEEGIDWVWNYAEHSGEDYGKLVRADRKIVCEPGSREAFEKFLKSGVLMTECLPGKKEACKLLVFPEPEDGGVERMFGYVGVC